MRRAGLTIAAAVLAGLGWWLAGRMVAMTGFGGLEWLAAAAGAFAALAFAEWAQARIPSP